jgi:hypothetical protein
MCCAFKSTLLNVVLWVLTLIGLAPLTGGWVASIEDWIGYTADDQAIIVTYKTVEDLDLWATIFKPPQQAESGTCPAIVFYHSNSMSSTENEARIELCKDFARLGYVSISFDYRPVTDTSTLDNSIQDAHDAIVWARENAADLGIDATHIAVMAYSVESFRTTKSAFLEELNLEDSEADVNFKPDALLVCPLLLELSTDTTMPAGFAIPEEAYLDLAQIREKLPPTLLVISEDTAPQEVDAAATFIKKTLDCGNVCELQIVETLDLSEESDEIEQAASARQETDIAVGEAIHAFLKSIGFWE